MAPFLNARRDRLATSTAADVEVVEVTNDYFGSSVTIAGLLAGADIERALDGGRDGDIVVLPAEALNADEVFIDSQPLTSLRERLAPARVVAGYEVTAALGALDEESS